MFRRLKTFLYRVIDSPNAGFLFSGLGTTLTLLLLGYVASSNRSQNQSLPVQWGAKTAQEYQRIVSEHVLALEQNETIVESTRVNTDPDIKCGYQTSRHNVVVLDRTRTSALTRNLSPNPQDYMVVLIQTRVQLEGCKDVLNRSIVLFDLSHHQYQTLWVKSGCGSWGNGDEGVKVTFSDTAQAWRVIPDGFLFKVYWRVAHGM